jgi:hypothetical protein
MRLLLGQRTGKNMPETEALFTVGLEAQAAAFATAVKQAVPIREL